MAATYKITGDQALPMSLKFQIKMNSDAPKVCYAFRTQNDKGKPAGVFAVWYGGESHMGHWFTPNGKCIAIVTRYKGDDSANDLYTADEWIAFFAEHTADFYDNWAADEWGM